MLADRVVVLDGGRIVADGSPSALRRRVGGEVVQVHDADGEVVRILPTAGTASDVARVLAGLPSSAQVTVRRPTMDEVFLHSRGRAGQRPSRHRSRHHGHRGGAGMSTVATAGRVFVGRSLRHSARDVEVLVMAVSFPVILMLLFTYVFGGALTGTPRRTRHTSRPERCCCARGSGRLPPRWVSRGT